VRRRRPRTGFQATRIPRKVGALEARRGPPLRQCALTREITQLITGARRKRQVREAVQRLRRRARGESVPVRKPGPKAPVDPEAEIFREDDLAELVFAGAATDEDMARLAAEEEEKS
jgi:hypothetical protein